MLNPDQKARDYTVLETCEVFRVTPPTVYRMLNEGKLDGYTIGRSRRITHESIERLRQNRPRAQKAERHGTG
jgi:excisionase family DNA binding protein